MSTLPIAEMVDVGKQYVKYEDVPTLLTGILRAPSKSRHGRLWAVRHLDLAAMPGESLGIIGRNGAGKSTLLAMLAGVTAPTEGRVTVRGRLAPLLRLGVGFHDELTGRENVYMNGMILGMSRSEIDKAFDAIVELAELERFIDTPVKFYSSGMQVRLGFASAIAANPDVLLVDEVLSVGDIGFQLKSFDKMTELQENGATLLVVSHNLEAIRRTCSRVIVLDSGSAVFSGGTDEGITIFHRLLSAESVSSADDAPVRIESFELYSQDGVATAAINAGDEVTFRMRVAFSTDVVDPGFGFTLVSDGGQVVYQDGVFGKPTGLFGAGSAAVFEARVTLPLTNGVYIATGGVRWGREQFEHAYAPRKSFSVMGRRLIGGMTDLAAQFDVVPIAAESTAGDEP